MDVTISKHAFNRAKERLGWKKSTLKRMIPKVLNEGIEHKNTKGSLRKWVSKQSFMSKGKGHGRTYVIHSNAIFIFKEETLLTMYQIPQKLTKHTQL